jgi:polyphosphate kinase
VIIKLNNLVDFGMISLIYQAAKAGVKFRLLIRGTCGVVPINANIEAYALIDRFLEHARVLVFHNGGKEQFFISSGDWMPRNLDTRIEVACPVYDEQLKKQLRDILNIQWNDNVKARVLDETQSNRFRKTRGRKIRSQYETYQYLKEQFG